MAFQDPGHRYLNGYLNRENLEHENDQFVYSQATQEQPPTQINSDNQVWIPTPSQTEPILEDEIPWATLHSLTRHVPKKSLMPGVNLLCIGREKNRLIPKSDRKVDLVIPADHQTAFSLSRRHCIIQRKGLNDEDLNSNSKNGGEECIRQMSKKPKMPCNRQNNSEVISIWDLSSNGTFVNGKKCEPNKWTKLEHGDQIALGSIIGQNDRPSRTFEWMISIPSQRIFPLNKKPEAHSITGQQVYDRYDLISPLGHGAFATTWKAFDRHSGEFRAIKVIQKKDHEHNTQNLVNFQREIEILKKVNHPNIVKFFESFEDSDFIWIVLELVDGGEYLDYVCDTNGLDEESCQIITSMLLQALAYLAALNIAHRDLKPENILMTSGVNPRPKIADFGLAKQLTKPNARFKTQCGTPAYLAPEIVVPTLNSKKRGYTVAVDMYSLGVIVYAALGNCSPFEGQEQRGDIRQICKERKVDTSVLSELKPNISEAALEFITKLTTPNAEERMSANEALEHRWIRESVIEWPQKACQLPTNHTLSSSALKDESTLPNLIRPVRDQAEDYNHPRLNDWQEEVTSEFDWPNRLDVMDGIDKIPKKKSLTDLSRYESVQTHEDQRVDMVNEMCSQQLGKMKLETSNECSAEQEGHLVVQTSAPPSCSNTGSESNYSIPISPNEPNIMDQKLKQEEDFTSSKRKLRQWSTSPELKANQQSELDEKRIPKMKLFKELKVEKKEIELNEIKPNEKVYKALKKINSNQNELMIKDQVDVEENSISFQPKGFIENQNQNGKGKGKGKGKEKGKEGLEENDEEIHPKKKRNCKI
ncbi:kinase-like domain-containing protein [Melampsora americana]|nr:kinase-like domain-containing protein [Melampsora americana]